MKAVLSRKRQFVGALLCLVFLASAPASRAAIRYEVSLDRPEQHLFHVTMKIPGVQDSVVVQMAAWNGLYQVRDFSAHVRQVEAFVGENRLPVEKLNKQTWRVTGTGDVSVQYSTYWDEPGPFATQLNAEHSFINPAMILMYVPERRAEGVQLNVTWSGGQSWRPAGPPNLMFGEIGGAAAAVVSAASFDELTDEPLEIGDIGKFRIEGVKPDIFVVIHGDGWHKKRVQEELRRICEYEISLMSGAPFQRYTFIFHIGKAAEGAGGGMEHANSTAIAIPSDEYLAGVSAHEFFHLWNVKRIRPASLEPVDYAKEQYTRALWFAEGVTNTYASYALVRSGIWSKNQFYRDLGDQITELESRPANQWQSAEQSSLDAWLEKYALYNGGQSSVSYYTKGQVLGFLLDILIRDRTDNQESLDDVLRGMNEEFAKKGRPYRDSLDVRLVAEKVAGGSFADFFEHYISGAQPLPYSEVLALAGLDLHRSERLTAELGFTAGSSDGTLVIASVEGALAQRSGLRSGDVIQKWNDKPAPANQGRWLRGQRPGSELRLRIRREGKEMTVAFPLGERTESFEDVREDVHASEKARRVRYGLLHGETDAAAAAH